ncbi:MAG TPA: hypothetical protein VHH15_21415 [Actinophytocola sp.]|nr:hypothetical protein [Actinophytocola sp.]
MIVVKRVVQVRLLPTRDQESALLRTLRTCNEAASWLSQRMHELRLFRKVEVQKKFYTELRERFGLSAQPSIRVIGKVVDAYTTLRANVRAGNYGPPGSRRRHRVEATPIVFRPDAGQPFDASSEPIGKPVHKGQATSPFHQGRVHDRLNLLDMSEAKTPWGSTAARTLRHSSMRG